MNKERIVFADYLRILACFLVMLVHASENFYSANDPGLVGNMALLATEANRFWVAFYDAFVARTCVPVFMMLSCFLLVPMREGETMGSFYRRRFARILPPFIFFLFAYSLLPLLWGGTTWETAVADLKLLPWNFTSLCGHLWFMYPLISIYLIIPVISPWIAKASARDERIFLGIWVISLFLPFIHRFVVAEVWGECFWNGFNGLWYCSGYIGYLVLAHYIRTHIDWSARKRILIGVSCWIIGSAFTGWSMWFKGVPGQLIETPMLEWAMEFCTPNVALATFGIFLAFSAIDVRGKEHLQTPACVVKMSKMTFGMYLMHMFFLTPIATWLIGPGVENPLLPVWAVIPVIAILTFCCCTATTWLLSHIPGSKWFVGV